MKTRLLSASSSEMLQLTSLELKQAIKASEGRTIVSENVAPRPSWTGDDLTNAEVAAAFSADLILLNCVDVFDVQISGLPATDQPILELRRLVGRPIGVNLEPIDLDVDMTEKRLELVEGRQATAKTFQEIEALGFDFVCLTGNPGTGVSNNQIERAIQQAKDYFSGLIIAGKMHAAGSNEAVIDLETVRRFIEAGADVILVPAVGTVPGFTEDDLRAIVEEVHAHDALIMSAIGTSQEGSDTTIVRDIAIRNKICGVDIHHIGDAGYSGIAPVENIFALSDAIRGKRHTIVRMSRSIRR
ncbi:TPA: haloacid dehalogenase-like hydrolase [Streptococcus equi subsp. zooepidemicus]|uniref:Dihydrodipicolinate synthase n=1 Tax=Streptococcus equi subsp. zooepidemicus (strain MGCS10565) TaxID=552526 RepID=B4U447_STREM|nr:PEP phosphonomutase [Streptococcus equi]ACG62764.1 dihydrodipicolinate synthase [Streptococcus equi subsp. zooepidemicus MGCS10565]MCD3369503.1 haloacid dehalogenase-like hydrolase [Streptococcus equi subsp. zooepidemicus]MCD3380719.1 haloacid dehalogenase-like hydrolase [Streptococcus equi subsp. zooepidemicus]MCD3391452.1 haloacid dehalogenase-like hydrolase [Streptococcus equi subsp. zooepidemicus]MCD3415793.1 haloacid dehalogenase-like hydrolase [Streptococcus equi subsp. zooepidemicus]